MLGPSANAKISRRYCRFGNNPARLVRTILELREASDLTTITNITTSTCNHGEPHLPNATSFYSMLRRFLGTSSRLRRQEAEEEVV